jgi:hypothetical protein
LQAFCIVLAACCASCAGPGDSDTRVTSTESSADTILTSVQLSIGAVDTPAAEVIGRVYAAFLLGDRLFVSNGEEPEIREYDLTGQLIKHIGRRGPGPGEFTHLRWIAPIAGDSLLALDGLASRATVFDPDGRFARSFELPLPMLGEVGWIAEYGDGFAYGYLRGVDARRVRGVVRDTFFIALIGRSPVRGDTAGQVIGAVPGSWWRRYRSPRGIGIQQVEGGPHPLVAIVNSSILVSSSDVHLVRRWSGSAWEDIPLVGQNWTNGYVVSPSDVEDWPTIAMPLYDQIVPAPNGEFWLSDFLPGDDGQRKWRIFDLHGNLKGVAFLPKGFRAWQVTPSRIIGKLVTEDGVEFVQVRALTRPDSVAN